MLKKWTIYLICIGLIILAIVWAILYLYNSAHRLTREKLERARSTWASRALKDYDFSVSVTGSTEGKYDLKVRDGRLVEAYHNGLPFKPLSKASYWTVEGLFDVLQMDAERTDSTQDVTLYTFVIFDQEYGYPRKYIRAELGGRGAGITLEARLTPAPPRDR